MAAAPLLPATIANLEPASASETDFEANDGPGLLVQQRAFVGRRTDPDPIGSPSFLGVGARPLPVHLGDSSAWTVWTLHLNEAKYTSYSQLLVYQSLNQIRTIGPSMLANANRPSHIETLISGVDRYNPSNVHLLEDYLQQQLANDQYDLLANLALLKLYQFNPAILSPPATLSVLFLSLVHAPFSPDFSLAWALLSDSFVVGAALPPAAPDSDDDDDEEDQTPARPAEPHGEKETALRLFELSKLLQARKLRAFWTLFRQGQEGGDREDEVRARVKGLVDAAQGCEERVRASMAHEIERSFRSIKKSTLEGFLGISDSSQLTQLASARGWTVRDSEVQLPANDSNTPKGQVTHERIEIEQLTRLLGRTQA